MIGQLEVGLAIYSKHHRKSKKINQNFITAYETSYNYDSEIENVIFNNYSNMVKYQKCSELFKFNHVTQFLNQKNTISLNLYAKSITGIDNGNEILKESINFYSKNFHLF